MFICLNFVCCRSNLNPVRAEVLAFQPNRKVQAYHDSLVGHVNTAVYDIVWKR